MMINLQVHKYRSTQRPKGTCRSFLCTCARVFLCSFSFIGCTQVKQIQHLEPLLTLKEYADEKDAQEKWVSKESEHFKEIVTAIKDQTIAGFKDKESIRQQFGEPVLQEEITEDDILIQRWLYRHPIQKLAADRVYVYFDSQDQLLRSEHIVLPADDQI